MVLGDEDDSPVDSLALKLFLEMWWALNKQQAARHEGELLKSKSVSVTHILVPPSPTDANAAIRNSLTVLTGMIGNIDNVPTSQEEVTAGVTPRMRKRQCLTKNDCGDTISKLKDNSGEFYSSFSLL